MAKTPRISYLLVAFLCLVTLFSATAFAKEKKKGKADFDFAKTSAFMREMETRPDFPVATVLANDYVFSLVAMGEKIDVGRQNAVIAYLKLAQQKNGGFVADKANKTPSILYTDIALETLGYLNATNAINAGSVKTFVASLKNPDGGFGFSHESKASILATTYYAVHILKSINGLDVVDKAKTAAYVKDFEKKEGGFGSVKGAGAANTRNTYLAVFILSSIGALDDATRGNSVKFLAATPYLDRKSSERPELDEQYYAIKALKELKSGDRVDKKIATAFLKKLYIPVNGGFGPLEGYGSTPDSTTTGLRILAEIGKLNAPGAIVAKK